jgi:hypothetical protein
MSCLFFVEKGGKNEPPKRAAVTLAESTAQRSLDKPHRVALVSGVLKRNVAAPPLVFSRNGFNIISMTTQSLQTMNASPRSLIVAELGVCHPQPIHDRYHQITTIKYLYFLDLCIFG